MLHSCKGPPPTGEPFTHLDLSPMTSGWPIALRRGLPRQGLIDPRLEDGTERLGSYPMWRGRIQEARMHSRSVPSDPVPRPCTGTPVCPPVTPLNLQFLQRGLSEPLCLSCASPSCPEAVWSVGECVPGFCASLVASKDRTGL